VARSAGAAALILPTLGRTEADVQAAGPQVVTVEDSMGAVHASRGRLAPAGPALRSEVAIVAGLAAATLARRADPETNVLVPLDSTAERSNTPTSKSVLIRLERRRR